MAEPEVEKWTMQVVSDIHLEMRKGHVPRIERHQNARFLALCGDIGRPFTEPYRELLAQVSAAFEYVVVLCGNHEYYGKGNNTNNRSSPPAYKTKTMSEIEAQVHLLTSALPNVMFLQNSALMLDGVRLLGTTLWSYIPLESRAEAKDRMNDYHLCYTGTSASTLQNGVRPPLLTPEVVTALHQQAVEFLRRSLADDPATPTVILTHHAPTLRNSQNPKYANDTLQCCYATNLEPLMRSPPVRAWCYGHTHWNSDQLINGVRVVTSPAGYPHERQCTGLTQPAVIVI